MDFGTRVFTYFRGKQIGSDVAGNRYFTERRPSTRRTRIRRWVIYPGIPDPSSVPAEWHAWLHYTTEAPLLEMPRHSWQKVHLANATGTAPLIARRAMITPGENGRRRMAITRAGFRLIRKAVNYRRRQHSHSRTLFSPWSDT